MTTFHAGYRAQLLEHYPAEIIDQITGDVRRAPLSAQPGEHLPYVYVQNADASENAPTIFYVPGFGEGIVNKASFAAKLAVLGANVILPGQNRRSILKETGTKSSIYTQAQNYLSVLDHAEADDFVVVTHSFGSLVFQKMTELDTQRFKDNDAILLAPAGFIKDESYAKLGWRWHAMIRSESNKDRPMEFPDPEGVTGKASQKTLAENVPRMLKELSELVHGRVDCEQLLKAVRSLIVLTYAEDKLYPEDKLFTVLSKAVELGVTWATPVSIEGVIYGAMKYSGDGAVHDDEQYNPSRVAQAVLQFARAA